ncbi:hypothetical protein L596_021147 [Steinernema carpocapsae]|uniref:Uncharacterized protein n=1 Tax=Steinernema carpocapsae TaxID=34508 RepID=A0A4U5MVM7_STECR|nr:hypothetical protein L596_021147 [Steinernema carpocapsae]
MLKLHPEFRILSVSRDLSEERISPTTIRNAIEDVKNALTTRKGELIGITIEKCPLTVILMLGILDSGNAFIFIPSELEAYVQVIAERFKINSLIRRHETPYSEKFGVDATTLWMQRCGEFQMPWEERIAYAIQTSGTTGKPKTVHVPWECISANIDDFRERFNVTSTDRILQLTSFTFDPSMVELLLAAESGSELLIFSEEIGLPTLSSQPAVLANLISKFRPNFLQMTPSCLAQFRRDFLAELLGSRSPIRVLLVGGEAFPLNLVNGLRSDDNATRIFNVYGVTEVSCWASVQEIRLREKLIHAGEAIKDTLLSVEGGGVVLGGERFCFVNFDTNKALPLKTGDLGRVQDGKIVVTGRYKPNAILPSTEVEDLLLSTFQEVEMAKVMFDGNFAVLFYKSMEASDKEVMEAIAAHFPVTKRPGLVCHVEEWPMTGNGKVNEEALLSLARTKFQINSTRRIKALLSEYTIDMDRDSSETFQNLGFSSLHATELLFKLDPLINDEVKGKIHQLMLSADGTVADLLGYLDFRDLKASKDEADVVEITVANEEADLELLWEEDLKKCIDASPVILDGSILVGSHAGLIKVIDLKTGDVKLRLEADGRIEKTCGFGDKYIAFGTYKGEIYVLDRVSLELVTVVTLGEDVVKCTPVFDAANRLLCGSHDKNLVKYDVEEDTMLFSTSLEGPIVSTPLLLGEEAIVTATLRGFVYLLDQDSGEILAETRIKSPIFAPVVAFAEGFLVTAVTGTVALFDRQLKKLASIDLNTHFYDAPNVVSASELIACGHNGSIHVISFDGTDLRLTRTILWKDTTLVKAPVLFQSCFVFSATNGTVIAIPKEDLLDPKDAEIKAKKLLKLQGETFGTPVVLKTEDGCKLVIGSRDNFVRSFNVDKGVFEETGVE